MSRAHRFNSFAILIALFVCAFPVLTQAQDPLNQAGTPTFTASVPVELGFLNASNGNVHITIPFGSFAQRGSRTFAAGLVYDSRIWKGSSGTKWQPTNILNSQGGWRFITTADPGTVDFQQKTIRCVLARRGFTIFKYSNFTWTAPDGTVRSFPIATESDPNGCDQTGIDTPTANKFATDSSGFKMFITNYTDATVFAPDGTQVYPSFKDSNGNYFSSDANGNVIDTLGRIPVKVTPNCNANPSQTCYDVANSQGSTSRITVTTETISVDTAFGQTGITECSTSCTLTVIQSVALPDGTSYQFNYDSGTTSGHYGLLTSVTLPTGGTATYGYSTFQDANGNRNRWLTSHIVGGGQWTFTPSVITTCPAGGTGCQESLTVVKPSGDNAVYTFTLNNGAWASQTQFYAGTISSSNLAATVSTVWNFSNPCTLPACTGNSNIQMQTQTTALAIPGGVSINSTKQFTYDSINDSNVTQIVETPSGATTSISYFAGYSNNLINLPSSITTKDTSGNQFAQTSITYDSYGTGGLVSVTGASEHDDLNFGVSFTARGNATQIQRCAVLPATGACTTALTTSLTYDTTGQVRSYQDPIGNTTTLNYTDSFYSDNGSNPPLAFTPAAPTNAYLTQITLPLIGASTISYYYNTGKRAVSTDQNGANSFSHFQDPLDRLTTSFGPLLNGVRPWNLQVYAPSDTQIDTYLGIGDTSPSTGCSSCRHDSSVSDNLGRSTSQSLASDPEGSTTSTTSYDGNGRMLNTSHPFRTVSDPTYGFETPSYDGLDRVKKTTHQDGTFIQVFYGSAVASGGGLTTQLCPLGLLLYPQLTVDEAGKKREVWIDGAGRTGEVDEPDSSGNLTQKTCYTYDVLSRLTQAVSGAQTRTFSYDALSRLTSKTVPESGTTNFFYTTSAGIPCSGEPSVVCRRTDSRGITTTYSYDALNRPVSKTYSDSTASVGYFYDQTSFNGLTITNGKGRRTGMSDGSGTTAWSFDAAGHVLSERRTIAGITRTISYTYNLDGSIATITYPSGRQVNYTVSNAERLTAAKDAGTGTQYGGFASYAAPGQLQGLITGQVSGGFAGVSESHTYNSRLEYTGTQASSSTGTALNLSFNYNLPGGNNGNVASIVNNVDSGRTESFQYDFLNRIGAASSQAISGADCWGQGFVLDPLANLTAMNVTQCSAGSLSATVNGNNQFVGFSYDSAGNMTGDGVFTYSYDAENRITSAAGVTYSYDGNGLRVEKSNGTLYWRSLSGDALAETDLSGNVVSEYVFMAGRRLARLDASAHVFYYFPDPLGNTRTITDSSGNVCYDADFTPYGQELNHANACPQNYKFTGYERDAETGLDYAFARYYNPRLGRFMSTDPLGGSVNDAQSLNAYAYVVNNPANATDPTGLAPQCRAVGSSSCLGLLPAPATDPLGCSLDGISADCGFVGSVVRAGATGLCLGAGCRLTLSLDPEFPGIYRITISLPPYVTYSGKCDNNDCSTTPPTMIVYPQISFLASLGDAGWSDSTSAAASSGKSNGAGDNSCLSGFGNSKVGSAVKFFSAINGAVNFREAWPDWTMLPGAKAATVYAASKVSSTIGNTEFLSITGGESTIITGPTAAGIDAVESSWVGPAGLLLIPFATAVDAGVRDFCSHLPNATLRFSAPQ